jgi:hypothetical protein
MVRMQRSSWLGISVCYVRRRRRRRAGSVSMPHSQSGTRGIPSAQRCRLVISSHRLLSARPLLGDQVAGFMRRRAGCRSGRHRQCPLGSLDRSHGRVIAPVQDSTGDTVGCSVTRIVNAKDTVNLEVEVCTMAQPSVLS